jgi:lipopolysaccharide transport system permease protein
VRHATDLVTHLVAREFRLRYRKAVLGWLWAIGQPLARLVVLTFIFTQVIDLGIEDYSVFLFTGLIAWTWFAAGIRSVTTSVVDRRDLLFRPGVPRVTVPVISALTDGLDYLAALPVLALFLVMSNGIPGTAVLLPLIMAIQFLLILGIGLPLCAANVYFRDVALFVDVALVLGFYLTPVFYDPASIPATYRFLIELNPIAQLIDIYRSILVDARLPEVSAVASVAVVGVVLSAVGLSVYRAASPNFIDEL